MSSQSLSPVPTTLPMPLPEVFGAHLRNYTVLSCTPQYSHSLDDAGWAALQPTLSATFASDGRATTSTSSSSQVLLPTAAVSSSSQLELLQLWGSWIAGTWSPRLWVWCTPTPSKVRNRKLLAALRHCLPLFPLASAANTQPSASPHLQPPAAPVGFLLAQVAMTLSLLRIAFLTGCLWAPNSTLHEIRSSDVVYSPLRGPRVPTAPTAQDFCAGCFGAIGINFLLPRTFRPLSATS
ncbi:hypothetical protein A4X06_0g6179 [Tilletia controversa]|uniref:Uncharacterized protein n=1 Tax=Tilletia controversa TaxID=13291 RepID=A0A8X7SVI9_9BASI|nr:hypothetical protein A4X06_0g6179 [Tilletia controversa]